MSISTAYRAGYDYGYTNKATTKNCHFSYFGNPESSDDWTEGKKQGEADRRAGRKRHYRFNARSPVANPLRSVLAKIAGGSEP